MAVGVERGFLDALAPDARSRFADTEALAASLDALRTTACAAYPDIAVDAGTFVSELARRLGAAATPAQLARVRADHVHLAIACVAGDDKAVRRCEGDFLDEVDACAHRARATRDQADEVRATLRRILFVSEPDRPAALREFSGRGDLRSYIRVIAMRELVRVVNKGRREVPIDDESFLDKLSPGSHPAVGFLRETYRADVDAAIRAALVGLSDDARALLRYSLMDGWTVDRIGALYGVSRSTAARRVGEARAALGDAIRAQLSTRLAISVDEVDSVVRMVQSRVDLSLERLLS
jgi:RNA polymerase sigma-70 factor (ECF subfamily)